MEEQPEREKTISELLDEILARKGLNPVPTLRPKEPRAWVIFPRHPLAKKLRELHRSKNAKFFE